MLSVKGWEDLTFLGVGEETIPFPADTKDGTGRVQTVGLARKLAYQHACEKSFSQLVLVTLPSGKISVHRLCHSDRAPGSDQCTQSTA